jgi:hypothetical protein
MKYSCNNCQNHFEPDEEGLVVRQGRVNIAATVCGACLDNVQVMKLVLRQRGLGNFTYEQYQPIEMIKGKSHSDG